MNRTRFISTIVVALLAWTIAGAEAQHVVQKPKPPLSVIIEPQDGSNAAEIRPGQVIGLKVVVRSFIDLPRIDVTVSAGSGAEIIAGETSWSGPLQKDQEKTWNVSVRASKKGYGKIIVLAEEGAGNKKTFRAEAVYEIGKSTGGKLPEGKKVKDRQDRDVIEYEVK